MKTVGKEKGPGRTAEDASLVEGPRVRRPRTGSMKTLKSALEDIITTDAFQPSNLVATRMPDGGLAKPSRGPQRANGRLRLRKKAKQNNIFKRPTMYRIQPAVWGDGGSDAGDAK